MRKGYNDHLGGLVAILSQGLPQADGVDGADWIPLFESAINDLVLLGGGIFLETARGLPHGLAG